MRFFDFLSTFVSVTGISLITIFSVVATLLSKHITYKKFWFTKNTLYKCTRGYIEPTYEVDKKIQANKIMKKLKKLVFKNAASKIIYLVGDSGIGKTNLTNCFIWKYDTYSRLKGKNIMRIFGLECENFLEAIKSIENKENVILIIDGLEEGYIYKKNSILNLPEINKELLLFYRILITINTEFYMQNSKSLNEIHYRNADQKKIFPTILFLKPFSDNKIIEYINKNLKLKRKDKKFIVNQAMKHSDFFGSPLLLSYITLIDFKEDDFSSLSKLLDCILFSSLEREENKNSKTDDSVKKRQDILKIMNRISWLYMRGKRPVLNSKLIVNNELLVYNKEKQEYRFKHNLFLSYNTVRKFHTKLPKYRESLKIDINLKNFYNEKILYRHYNLIENSDSISFKIDVFFALIITDVSVFKERWLMGLLKSLLDWDVHLGNIVLESYKVYQISRQYFLKRHLQLRGIEINEEQLVWWSKLSIKSLDISNTKIHKIVIPENWIGLLSLYAENLQLESCSALNSLWKLKELDLSGVQISNIKDLQKLTKFPDGISIDWAKCGITNENIPTVLFSTRFNEVYLDYNRLKNPDFILNMKYEYLNISNNPIIINEDQYLLDKRIDCNFYFKSEKITDCFCKNKLFLTYKQAFNMKTIDLSSIKVSNMEGLENLPCLGVVEINLFQTILINDIFKDSQLTMINVKAYGRSFLTRLKKFYISLKTIVVNYRDYGEVCSAIKGIIEYTSFILDTFGTEYYLIRDGALDSKCSHSSAILDLVDYMNIDLGLFLRRVVDVANYVKNYWDGDVIYENKISKKKLKGNEKKGLAVGCVVEFDYNKMVKIDFNNKLSSLCDLLKIKSISEEKSELLLLNFFTPVYDFLDKCVYTEEEMETILSERVGRKIIVNYLDKYIIK